MKRNFILVLAAAALLTAGACAKQMPDTITQLDRAYRDALDSCASVYAGSEAENLRSEIDAMNQLAGDKKYKRAEEQAMSLQPRVEELRATADRLRKERQSQADNAIARAEKELNAAREAGADNHANAPFSKARTRLEEAKTLRRDPCKAAQAGPAADEAARLAAGAQQASRDAVARLEAERKRSEEEARLAEERRRREEEERRRNARPPQVTVAAGDTLWHIAAREKIYGNPLHWPLVFEANRGAITDPDRIYPGQVLKITRNLTSDEAERQVRTFYRTYGGQRAAN